MVKNHSVTPRIHQSIQKHFSVDTQVRKFSKTYDKRNYYFQVLVVFDGSGFLFIVRERPQKRLLKLTMYCNTYVHCYGIYQTESVEL